MIVAGLVDMSGLSCEKPVKVITNRGSMLDNILGAVEAIKMQSPKADAALVVASDIPAITAEMVDWLVENVASSDCNVFYNVITSQVMEKRFPNSNRTYLKFKDVAVCGGDLNAFRFDAISVGNPNWDKLIGARKSPLKQASLLGYDTLLYLLLRRLSLDQAVAMASKRLGIRGKAILCPYAEIGMDVDKPSQLEILRQDLAPGLPA